MVAPVTKIKLEYTSDSDPADALIELIDELRAIDLHSPMAALNEITMSDNNGGRIEL